MNTTASTSTDPSNTASDDGSASTGKETSAVLWPFVSAYALLHATLWAQQLWIACVDSLIGVYPLQLQIATEYVRLAMLSAAVIALIMNRARALHIAAASAAALFLAVRPELGLFFQVEDWLGSFAMEYGVPVLLAIALSLVLTPYLAAIIYKEKRRGNGTGHERPFGTSYLLVATTVIAFALVIFRYSVNEQLARHAICLGLCTWLVATTATTVFFTETLRWWMLSLIPLTALAITLSLDSMVNWAPGLTYFGVVEGSYTALVALITLCLRHHRLRSVSRISSRAM